VNGDIYIVRVRNCDTLLRENGDRNTGMVGKVIKLLREKGTCYTDGTWLY
jgi:hypothetical protein